MTKRSLPAPVIGLISIVLGLFALSGVLRTGFVIKGAQWLNEFFDWRIYEDWVGGIFFIYFMSLFICVAMITSAIIVVAMFFALCEWIGELVKDILQ